MSHVTCHMSLLFMSHVTRHMSLFFFLNRHVRCCKRGVAVLLGLLILLLVGALVLRGLLRLVSRRAESASPSISGVKAFATLPYARKKYFFSAAERSFYEILRRLVPGHTVFAKVRLADLVNVKK